LARQVVLSYCAALVPDKSLFQDDYFLSLDVVDYYMILEHSELNLCFRGLLLKGHAVCLACRICSLWLLGSISDLTLDRITYKCLPQEDTAIQHNCAYFTYLNFLHIIKLQRYVLKAELELYCNPSKNRVFKVHYRYA
jgi:hypothetical protein